MFDLVPSTIEGWLCTSIFLFAFALTFYVASKGSDSDFWK